MTTPVSWTRTVIRRIALAIFHLHTEFGDSRFSRSVDIIADVEIKNGSCDPNHAPFRGGLPSMG